MLSSAFSACVVCIDLWAVKAIVVRHLYRTLLSDNNSLPNINIRIYTTFRYKHVFRGQATECIGKKRRARYTQPTTNIQQNIQFRLLSYVPVLFFCLLPNCYCCFGFYPFRVFLLCCYRTIGTCTSTWTKQKRGAHTVGIASIVNPKKRGREKHTFRQYTQTHAYS